MASRPNPKLRVMVDTNVLLSGIVWPRWPYEILRYARQSEIELVLCPFIVEQAYRNVQKYFPDSLLYLGEILALCNYTEVADPTLEEIEAHAGLMRDPTDIPIAVTAINSQIDYFITTDKDFTDKTLENAQLQAKLRILLPGTFLREVMGWTSEQLEALRGRQWEDLR
jgi:putative PIN family toxin of toxin-antitoxin system